MRARERYVLLGPDEVDAEDLLALIVGTGVARHSSQAIARRLLDTFGDVQAVAAAPPAALTDIQGLGQARAVRVHAACALASRMARRQEPPVRIVSPACAWRTFRPRLEGLPHEELHAAYLDGRGGLLHLRRLTIGSTRFTVVDPAHVLRPAVQLGARGFVLGHNHPSGDPTPSDEDLDVTRRVQEAGRLLGIRLVDHLVIGRARFVALSELGLLAG